MQLFIEERSIHALRRKPLNMTLDDIDKHILRELQRNADRTSSQIADIVGLSPSACLRRINRLKKEGMIEKTVALINPSKTGNILTAIVTLEFALHTPEYRQRFQKLVLKEPAVSQCYIVTGSISCILIAHVKDMDEYTELADRLFDQDKNVAAFFTHFTMQTIKYDTAIVVS